MKAAPWLAAVGFLIIMSLGLDCGLLLGLSRPAPAGPALVVPDGRSWENVNDELNETVNSYPVAGAAR